MTTKALRSTRIVTPEGLRSGVLTIENGKIAAIVQDYHGEVTDYGDSYLMPGFVDIHVHGWGRGSFAWKGTRESVQAMSRDLVQAGVTSYLATSATMPQAFLERSLQAAAEYIETAPPGDGAEPVGIHMEGPYINKKYLGMQREDSLQPPSVAGFKHFNRLAKGHIRLMTLAPELDGALALIRYLHSQGITASAGHTDATFDQMTAAI
ncbi:MAG TPA: N-acetylglucosamine-6-phosphate deacetylase, partial [Enterobacteriaceae bacterium]|nr:N-acetylglucosamine-6-phosphate deacetylase [Enterobacteriaceae bacterium]